MLARPWRRRGRIKTVVLYGHKLSGNLLAIHRYWKTHAFDEFDMVFLTMDKAYHRQLRAEGVTSVLATRPAAIGLLACADAIISDHGLHVMSILVGRSSIKFIDVWHGFGFQGHEPHEFRVQHRYDEIWVASPLQRYFYTRRFGFDPRKVKATGYARMDRLVRRDADVPAIRQHLGLDGSDAGKIVLFAPTWRHEASGHSIYPFRLSSAQFLRGLSKVAQRTRNTVVIRAHLNTGLDAPSDYPGVVWIPFARFPDTEAMLLASDVLICDWSSIAMDWLLLNRPTIFLDVEPPFARGHTLDASHRYGDIAASAEALQRALEQCLCEPQAWHANHDEQMAQMRQLVFGGSADGDASMRCCRRLCEVLE